MSYAHPREIFDEMARLTPIYAGINYARIETQGLQWPCPTPDHPGTQFLHKDRFTRGKGLFHVISFRPPAEVPDNDFPLVLSTGRTLYHYNVGHQTMCSDAIHQKQNENFVNCTRRRGAARHRRRRPRPCAHAPGRSHRPSGGWAQGPPRALWMPFHFADQPTNRLTNDAFDNVTRTGEYKCCAASVEKASLVAPSQ